jgi:arylsulfatase A-like enzyme
MKPTNCLILLSLVFGTGVFAADPIEIRVHADTVRRIEVGPFSKSELERDIYFRSYHVPGMFSEERNAELQRIGAVPARGTNRFPLEPGERGAAFSRRSRDDSLANLEAVYRRAGQLYPGMVHALAYNHYADWMRQPPAKAQTKDLLEDWEKLSKADVLRKDLYQPMAELFVDWFSSLKNKGVSYPDYYSVKNEPTWEWDFKDFSQFTIDVARAVHGVHPDIRITGPCSAWPYPGAAFDQWERREKVFIDLAGGDVGGYDLHFYSKGHWSLPLDPKWQAQRVEAPSLHDSQRLGIKTVWDFGRVSAYLDLWNAYHLATWGGELKPMIISEFGRQTIYPQFGPWPNDFKPWLYMNTVVRQWMNFMERPEVRLTVPFILPESDREYAPMRGQALYTRFGAPQSMELTRTRFADFYSFFRDLEGTRLRYELGVGAAAAQGKVFVQPFRRGDQLYILLHNGGGYPHGSVSIDLSILSDNLPLSPRTIEQKRIFFAGPIPAPEAGAGIDGTLTIDAWDGYEPVTGSLLELAGEETRIVRVDLGDSVPQPAKERSEHRIYSADTVVPLKQRREAIARVSLSDVQLKAVSSARLVLSLARDNGFDHNAAVYVNGQLVGELDLSFSRGIAEFHAPVAIEVPATLLKPADNEVRVLFAKAVDGGHPKLVSTRLDLVTDKPLSTKPNIVLIFVDDMGYGDAGCYGDTNLVPTPNIDRLATGGVLFTDGYVTAPVCGPSRYGLLSGAYQQRFGIQWNEDCYGVIPGRQETPANNRIPFSQLLINETLARASYTTGIIGKWNLPNYPWTSFDETLSVIHFGADYWPGRSGRYRGVDEPKPVSSSKDIGWGPTRKGDEYLTDRLGQQAVDFIGRHKDKPFFLYLAFNAPHSPMQAKDSHREAVAHLPTEALRLYGAMMLSLDENVGRVLDALDTQGLANNTIVAFSSDNGATYAYNVDWPKDWPKELMGSVGPLSGHKGQMLEGGIRVPFLLRWPARLPAGQVYTAPVTTLDLYPTFCAAAGAEVPAETILDGVNLLPYLTGEKAGAPHTQLFWHAVNRGAVREGDWKLYIHGNISRLHDLAADIGEKQDLSRTYPEVKARLQQAYNEFVRQLPPRVNPGN